MVCVSEGNTADTFFFFFTWIFQHVHIWSCCWEMSVFFVSLSLSVGNNPAETHTPELALGERAWIPHQHSLLKRQMSSAQTGPIHRSFWGKIELWHTHHVGPERLRTLWLTSADGGRFYSHMAALKLLSATFYCAQKKKNKNKRSLCGRPLIVYKRYKLLRIRGSEVWSVRDMHPSIVRAGPPPNIS